MARPARSHAGAAALQPGPAANKSVMVIVTVLATGKLRVLFRASVEVWSQVIETIIEIIIMMMITIIDRASSLSTVPLPKRCSRFTRAEERRAEGKTQVDNAVDLNVEKPYEHGLRALPISLLFKRQLRSIRRPGSVQLSKPALPKTLLNQREPLGLDCRAVYGFSSRGPRNLASSMIRRCGS